MRVLMFCVLAAFVIAACSIPPQDPPPVPDHEPQYVVSAPPMVEIVDDQPCVVMPWNSSPTDSMAGLRNVWDGGRNLVELCVHVNGNPIRCTTYEVDCNAGKSHPTPQH